MVFSSLSVVDIMPPGGIITARRWGKVGEIRKKW
jgi:hypothetical protein